MDTCGGEAHHNTLSDIPAAVLARDTDTHDSGPGVGVAIENERYVVGPGLTRLPPGPACPHCVISGRRMLCTHVLHMHARTVPCPRLDPTTRLLRSCPPLLP